jgi:chromosome segregation ATPase
MLLAVEPTAGFLNFVQILCWIILPVLLSTLLVTSFLHYRRRKREAEKENNDGEVEFLQATPELVGYTNADGKFILFDHSQLIQEYKNRLSFNHARFTALKKDFGAMESRYVALARFTQTRLSTSKSRVMEHTQEKMPQPMETEINKLVKDHDAGKKELLDRLEQLNRSYQSLEQENNSLQAQLSMITATDEEKKNISKRWTEENALLRDKISEQEYLKDILDEKNAEISFLQSQVEQRIKNQHQAERQREKMAGELEEYKKEGHEISAHAESLKNELMLKQDEVDKLQTVICGKEEQLAEKEQALTAKLDQVVYLENAFGELKQQNELLNAELADKKDLLNILQQQLEDEQSAVRTAEQKLQAQKQLMRRLHKEFSTFMEEDREISPVIALKPGYANQDNEGLMVQ